MLRSYELPGKHYSKSWYFRLLKLNSSFISSILIDFVFYRDGGLVLFDIYSKGFDVSDKNLNNSFSK
jgi:hypothetical protein